MDWNCSDLLFGADMEEFRVEKTVKANKSLDEIEKLCIDESLCEMDKVLLLLGSMFDVQKVWAVGRIVPLLKKQGSSSLLMKLLSKVKFMMKPPVSLEVHKAVSQCFADLANDSSLQFVSFTTHFVPMILTEFENGSNAVYQIWLNCLLQSVSEISKDLIKHKVLNLVRSRCQLSQSIQARQSSCSIIGRIAGRMESYWIKQELLPLVRTLCQDVDEEVRINMCCELPRIAQALGSDGTKQVLLPELEELSKDDQIDVRCIAVSSLYEMITIVDEGSRKSTLIPIFIRFLEEAVGRRRRNVLDERENKLKLIDQMRVHAAQIIGRLCYDLKDLYTNDHITTLLQVYSDLSKTDTISSPNVTVVASPLKTQSTLCPGGIPNIFITTDNDYNDNGTECRRLSAYNIPGMILFSSSVKKMDRVLSVLKTLSTDSHRKVRLAVARGFHEVIKHLGNDSTSLIADYATLLQDTDPEVLSGLVTNLSVVLEVFTKAIKLDPKTRQPGLLELIQPLLSAEQVSSKHRQWRLHNNLLDNFSQLRHCMTSEQLYTNFVPVLWKYTGNTKRNQSNTGKSTTYVLPVKRAACRTMCLYITSIRKADQRKEICSKFVTECAQSNSYKQRLLFIEVCQMISDMFSRNFFKENGFFTALLAFSKDPTVNVRYCLCGMLPELKSFILLPVDREYQTLLESAIADLLMDKHPECLNRVRQSVKLMDKISYRMQSMVTYSLEGEVMDKEREDAERLMLKEEEEWEREKERECSNHRLFSDARKSAPTIKGGMSPGALKKRPNTLLGVKSKPQQQLSPAQMRKTNIQGPPSTLSPSLPSKLNTGKTKGTITSSYTPDTKRKPSLEQSSPDHSSRRSSSDGQPLGRQMSGSSPNILSNSSSPKVPKVTKQRDTASASATVKQSPVPGSQKGHSGLAYTTKAKRQQSKS